MATFSKVLDRIREAGLAAIFQKNPLFDPNDPNWLKFKELYRNPSGDLESSEEQICLEYQGLIAFAKNREIEVTQREIKVPIGKIHKRDSGLSWGSKRAYLGQFIFVYYTKPSLGDACLKIVKLNPELANYHANMMFGGWHSEEGICLGNLRNGLNDLIRKREFVMATSLLKDFLEVGESIGG